LKSGGVILMHSKISFAAPWAPNRRATDGGGEIRRKPISLTHRLQGWGAALVFGGFGLLPISWASAVGGAPARLIGPRLGVSKRARLNLRRALPELAERDVAKTIEAMWDNLGRVAAEYPHLRKIRVFIHVDAFERDAMRAREARSPAADLSALLGCLRPRRRDGSARHIQMAALSRPADFSAVLPIGVR